MDALAASSAMVRAFPVIACQQPSPFSSTAQGRLKEI